MKCNVYSMYNIFLIMLAQIIVRTYPIQLYSQKHRSVLVRGFKEIKHFSSAIDNNDVSSRVDTGDILMTGLNGSQDISVKVVSCKEVIQEAILRNNLSQEAAQALGELMVCSLMMGANLKGDETLQVNLVGTSGIRNIMAITDGNLKIRGMVGETKYSSGYSINNNENGILKMSTLLGHVGQVQVVRNHPTWKSPMNGITALRDLSIPLNLALYMAESEQRPTAILSEVKITGNLCRHALGVMVERLPGASEDNIDLSIKNLEMVEKKGLRSYLSRSPDNETEGGILQDNNVTTTTTNSDTTLDNKTTQSESLFRSFEPVLDQILDDCIIGMDKDSIRWSKLPQFRCSCGMDRVWRALRLLPKEEVSDLVAAGENVEMKCEFCGENYSLTTQQIKDMILNST